jgi:hypothetical protein
MSLEAPQNQERHEEVEPVIEEAANEPSYTAEGLETMQTKMASLRALREPLLAEFNKVMEALKKDPEQITEEERMKLADFRSLGAELQKVSIEISKLGLAIAKKRNEERAAA